MANIYQRLATYWSSGGAGGASGNNTEVQIWLCPSVSTPSGSFTVTAIHGDTANDSLALAVFELSSFSGLDGTPGIASLGSTGTTITATNPIADVGTADFVVAVASIGTAASSMSFPASGGAAWTSARHNTGAYDISYRQNASAVTDAATWTWTGSTHACAAIAAFQGTLVGGQIASAQSTSGNTVSATLPSHPTGGNAVLVVALTFGNNAAGTFFSAVNDNQGTPTGPYMVQSTPPYNFGAQGTPSFKLSGVTQGNTLLSPVVYQDTGNQSFFPSSVADGQANYSKDVPVASPGHGSASVYSLFNANSGSHTVTYTKATGATGANVYWIVQLQEWTGLANSLDLTATGSSTGTGPVTATTTALSNPNDVVLAVGGGDSGTIATPTTGWGTTTGWMTNALISLWPSGSIESIVPGSTAALTANLGTLSISNHWAIAIAAYRPLSLSGVLLTPGPGPSPMLGKTFGQRQLAVTLPPVPAGAFGASVALGYASGRGVAPTAALGLSQGAGFATGFGSASILGRPLLRGPGPSPDWEASLIQYRNLSTSLVFTPVGVASAVGMSTGAGFASPLPVGGVGSAIGASAAMGFANPVSVNNLTASGMSTGAGFANYTLYSALGFSVGMGYAAATTPVILIRLGDAIEILANAGFTVDPVIIWQYSSTVPWDYIISQLPVGGTVISYQTVPVQLTVSAGPAPATPVPVPVPAITGLPLLLAIQVITQARLNIGTINYVQAVSPPPNTLTGQSPAAGTLVTQYSAVNLTVCSGPVIDPLIGDPYTVPNVTFRDASNPPPVPPPPPPLVVPFVAGSAIPAGSSTPSGSD